MSWKGFTKAVARLPQRIGTKAGYAEETVDPEFVDLEDKFKGLETCVRKLHEDSRKFKDALFQMLDHQKRFSETLVEMFQPISSLKSGKSMSNLDLVQMNFVILTKQTKETQSAEIDTASQMLYSMDRVKEELLPHLQDIERLVIAPAGEYLMLFEQVKKYLVKRSHKLLDYDRYRESVKKLKENTNRSVSDEKKLSQMETSLDGATREYNNYNNLIKSEMPLFLDLRIEFIDPCFATFFDCQHKVYQILFAEFRKLADGHFDMSCSAMNGFVSKWDDAGSLLDELTIPRKRSTGSAGASATLDAKPTVSESSATPEDPNRISPKPGFASVHAAAAPAAVAAASSGSKSAVPVLPKPAAGPAKKYVIALYDFEAQADGDLSFKRDDKIEVIEKTNNQNDWWTGKVNGQTGQFPGNYVADV